MASRHERSFHCVKVIERSRSRAPTRFGVIRECTESICPKFRRSFTFCSSGPWSQFDLQKSDREPRHGRDHDGAGQEGQNVAQHRLDAFVGINPADRTGGVIADAEGRGEQADAHRKDHHHRVVHFMHADFLGDREQQRAEQHDRRDTFENAAEDDEGNDGYGEEHRHAAGQAGHHRCER